MLINSLSDAVFSIDQHGIVKTYNAAALNLLDTNRRIDGQHINDLLTAESTEGEELDIFDELSLSSSIRQRDDIIIRLPGDDHIRVDMTFAPAQVTSNADAPDSFVLIIKDITRQKSLEEERDEFISVVSHELRTPVTITEGILSNAELLAERGLHDQAISAIAEAQKQTVYLSKILNDLSMLSRAERGNEIDSEQINTLELGHQLHSEYSPQAQEKGLSFNLDVSGNPGNVFTSRLYLRELLQNLITNAIKYTPEGSVSLRIRKSGETIRFSVVDTGVGIGKTDRGRVFDQFYRAEDYRTRETSGTGLGLHVASKLANKMGCAISVESRLNHGSVFSFELPSAS